jgi:hypothetical protein
VGSVGDTGIETAASRVIVNPIAGSDALEQDPAPLGLDGRPRRDVHRPGGKRPRSTRAASATLPDGLRSPDRRLWAGDVGQSTVEEIDVVQSAGNYAWPRCEGTQPAGCQQPGDVDPVFEYLHSGAGVSGRSVTGGAFVSRSFGFIGGYYVFGDYTASKLWAAAPNAARDDIATPTDLVTGAAARFTWFPAPTAPSVAINAARSASWCRTSRVEGHHARLVPLVPRCRCTTLTRGPALAFDRNPPAQESAQLTVGTPDERDTTEPAPRARRR